MSARVYRFGQSYRDRGRPKDPEDQFMGWLNAGGRGMPNSGGIRPIGFRGKRRPAGDLPAAIVCITTNTRVATFNPWEDIVDVAAGEILYWGDAKAEEEKAYDEFAGNILLRRALECALEQRRDLMPPVLYFEKNETGWMRFGGLCALEAGEPSWFEEKGRPVKNYRWKLVILDTDQVEVDWIHRRATIEDSSDLLNGAPEVWKHCVRGDLRRLRMWKHRIRKPDAQRPPAGTDDAAVLGQLTQLQPREFERACVSMLENIPEVAHRIERTRDSGDGGFDFFGSFRLPAVDYEIRMRGEAKRWQPKQAIGVLEISRLVARLTRGEYGMFITTSYFGEQAQEEVIADRYPVHLVSGGDMVGMLRRLGLARGNELRADWLSQLRAG